jgi:hypothetical protein
MQTNQLDNFGSRETGLGDTLLLTSICKYNVGKYKIQLRPSQERFKILFDDLADTEVTEKINFPAQIGGGHYSTRLLRAFYKNADLLDNKPLVIHRDKDSEMWAESYLNQIKNPIIFVPTCAKRWSKIRNLPNDLVLNIFDSMAKQGFSPIVCSSKDNSPNIHHDVHTLIDLDLSKYISLLRKVGKYVGCNTGDMHLAISVGAECQVFQPQKNQFFYPEEWCYKSNNIKYVIF